MRMLEGEGFSYEGYVDIFDGGPTMTARTDKVASIVNSKESKLVATDCELGERALIATGQLSDFRCCYGACEITESGISIDSRTADILDVSLGDTLWSVAR